ncbi:hypothetical protein [Nostoc sp.]|uniref:hypothetical protein n=1 Tax=Nostoc sp. TaxID=1180 RepID=UPI002FF48C53
MICKRCLRRAVTLLRRSKGSYAVGVRETCRRQASRTRVRLPLGEEKALRDAIGDAPSTLPNR